MTITVKVTPAIGQASVQDLLAIRDTAGQHKTTAEQAAAAAGQHKTAAEQAADTAGQHKTAAEQAATTAGQHKAAAEQAAATAGLHKTATEQAAQQAGNSAADAASERSAAQSAAGFADSRANAAQTYANQSATYAAESLNHRNGAAAEAQRAREHADTAAAVVTGGTATLTPEPGKIPLADDKGKINGGWFDDQHIRDLLAKASPAQYPFRGKLPSLALEFARNRYHLVGDYGLETKQLTDVLTVSSGASTRLDHRGQIVDAAVNQPVIDYDPETGECLGLSVQEQRTNTFFHSEAFDNSYWTKRSGSSVQPNIVTSPDGTLTGDRHYNTDTTTSGSYIRRIESLTLNTTYTISLFVKKGTESTTRITLYTYDGGNKRNSCLFNFDTESIVMDVAQVGSPTCGFKKYKNGWYRIWLTSSSGLVKNSTNCIIDLGGGWTLPASTEAHWVYLWGAQLEIASFPSRYIKAEGSAVTRVADDIKRTMTGNEFNLTCFTIFLDIEVLGLSSTSGSEFGSLFNLQDDGNTNRIGIGISAGGFRLLTSSALAGIPYQNLSLGSYADLLGARKLAVTLGPNGINVYKDGVAILTKYRPGFRLDNATQLILQTATSAFKAAMYKGMLVYPFMTQAEAEELTA